MKRINLTENDIFNIVNKVIAEQISKKTPDELKRRFLDGDKNAKPKIPGMRGRTFEIKDKRGLNIESFSFILQDVDFIQGKNGASAIVKGYIKGQNESETNQTIFEFVCDSFGDFILKEYKGLDSNDIKKQKTPKPQQDDSESSFKTNVKQGIENLKQSQGVQNIKQGAQDFTQDIKQGVQDVAQNVQGKVRQGIQNFKNKLK
jgi:hypothetical protein